MLDKLLFQYNKFILSTKPSKIWQVIRFVLHWVTLPVKVSLIAGLGIFQIVKKKLTVKQRPVPGPVPIEYRRKVFQYVLKNLPVFKNEEIELYLPRVPYDQIPNGSNHNTDHQCLRQSTYHFLMEKLGLVNDQLSTATRDHIQHKWLVRGYSKDVLNDSMNYNAQTISGDMLCGLNLVMLNTKDDLLKDRFEVLIEAVLDNDFSLLEHDRPGSQDPIAPVYEHYYKQAMERPEIMEMKSYKARWEPGLEVVGAQALTLLSALRVAEKVCKSGRAGKAYRKMLWQYGYGLLSLFPTAYIESKRGYFNEHNCLMALYTLSKLSDSKLGKLFWKIPMLYTWMLSKHWYNGYFTGLVKDCYPESVDRSYIVDCKSYLYDDPEDDNDFSVFTIVTDAIGEKTELEPVSYILTPEDEFNPENKRNIRMKFSEIFDSPKYKGGLGFIAHAIMLEHDVKKLLE